MATPNSTGTDPAQDYSNTDNSESSEIELEYLYEVRALSDFTSQEADDISFLKEDILYVIDDSRQDGWLLAYNDNGDQGLVPGNYVAVETVDEEREEEPKLKQSGVNLWEKVRKSAAPDAFRLALRGLGVTLPSGFRESTLAKFDTSTLSTRFTPRLSLTGLTWVDPCVKSQHSTPALIREISILYASNIPEVDSQLEVIKCQIRICIFDRRTNLLSNMLSLSAVMSSGDKNTWKLSKGASTRDVVLSVKKTDPNLDLVLELGVSYKKEGIQEMSTGWACLPLFKQNTHTALQNKTYGVSINGGNLFQEGVELVPNTNISNKKSLFFSNRKPTIFIRFSPVSRTNRDLITFLPDDVIIPKAYLPLINRYQKVSSQILACSSLDLSSPEIYVFLTALDRPFIMDTVVQQWNDVNQNKRRTQRNDLIQNQCLIDFILQKMYPLVVSPYLEEQLSKETLSGDNESDSPLLAYNNHFTPFNISETITDFTPQ